MTVLGYALGIALLLLAARGLMLTIDQTIAYIDSGKLQRAYSVLSGTDTPTYTMRLPLTPHACQCHLCKRQRALFDYAQVPAGPDCYIEGN